MAHDDQREAERLFRRAREAFKTDNAGEGLRLLAEGEARFPFWRRESGEPRFARERLAFYLRTRDNAAASPMPHSASISA